MSKNALAMYSVSDMQTMATAVAKSGLFGMKSPEQALALMLVAQAENQHPATITQDYDIIQGRACRKTHSVMARFQAMGGKIEWHKLDDQIADATFSHPASSPLRLQWTIEQAKKIGLTNKDNWKNYPRAMLRARVIAEGVRTVYPAAIGGMMIAEEVQDAPAERDMGTAERVEPLRPELPNYSQADFDKNLPAWRAAIEGGKRSAEQIISMVSTKGVLDEEQRRAIRACEADEETGEVPDTDEWGAAYDAASGQE